MFKKMLLVATLCATGLSIESKGLFSQICQDLKIEGQRFKKAISHVNIGKTIFYSRPATAFRESIHTAYHNAQNRENMFKQAQTAFKNSTLGAAYNKADKAFENAILSSTILNRSYDWMQYIKNS